MVSATSFTFLLDVSKLPIQDEMDFIHAKRHRSRGTKGPPWKNFCLRLGLHCARFHESGTFCWHQIFLSCSLTVAWISSDCYWLEVKTTRSNRMKFGLHAQVFVSEIKTPRWTSVFWRFWIRNLTWILSVWMNVLRFIISVNVACQP